MGQPQEHGRKETPREAVPSVLNTHNKHPNPIDVDVTPRQCDGDHSGSQSSKESSRWDVHSSMDMDD